MLDALLLAATSWDPGEEGGNQDDSEDDDVGDGDDGDHLQHNTRFKQEAPLETMTMIIALMTLMIMKARGSLMITIMTTIIIMFTISTIPPRFNKRGEPLEMPGHSIPLAGLGGFILIFGFLAFNGGSQVNR